jgi:hypothetical protein
MAHPIHARKTQEIGISSFVQGMWMVLERKRNIFVRASTGTSQPETGECDLAIGNPIWSILTQPHQKLPNMGAFYPLSRI